VLIDFLDPKQRLQIENYVDEAGGRHPAWSIMNAGSSTVSYERSPKDFLANEAVHFIKQDGNSETWFNNTLKRVAQTGDLEESASAIAEICCYGAMREAGFTVRAIRPASTPKPDFEFSLENTTGVIEVATKLAHDRRVRRVRQIADGETPPGVERSKFKISGTKITSLKAEVHPFGPPNPDKLGDTTQTNAISRICSIKAKETQFVEGLPSILWIDFRHLGQWPAVLTEKQSSPLICGRHGTLCSGAIWYAFFGWNGAPVFDDKIGGGYTVTPMAHDGRFYKGAIKSSRYSAAIICLQKATILFENPVTKTPLTDEQRATLTRLPWFSLEYSAAEWRPGDLDRAHELARSMISALEKHAGHSNPVWG
jgi:hypothetical protein